MFTELTSILGSLNSARQMATAIIELRDFELIRDKISEFKDRLSDAQDGIFRIGQERAELAERIRQLEGQIAEIENWNAEKGRYKLEETGRGGLSYVLKENESNGEPPHKICANCFPQRRSFLMYASNEKGKQVLKCARCPAEVRLNVARQAPPARSAPSRQSWL